MARILIGTIPVIGHINPMLPLARALLARGHEVCWYSGSKYRAKIEATGVRYLPMQQARDLDDANFAGEFPERAELKGLAQLKYDLKHLFIDQAVGQLRDIQAILANFKADLMLVDPGFIGGFFQHKLAGTPLAVLNIVPMSMTSRDTAPFGLGLLPSSSPLGRLRNGLLNWVVPNIIFRDVQRHWNATLATIGLPPSGWLMDASTQASLYMQPSVPGFEYSRSDLPPTVHFIGMLPVDAPAGWNPPAWWGELDGSRPVVHVSQGTIANTRPELIAPTLAGLADEDVLVVVSTGNRPLSELGLERVPANVRAATFLSYPELLPHTAAMVTNGGYGGVQFALSHGVPLAVGGISEDKPEVANRVAWSGAGINLKTATPTPAQVRAAVRALLGDGSYRARARGLQAEYASYDALQNGITLIERLAATGRPVLREAAPAPASWKGVATVQP